VQTQRPIMRLSIATNILLAHEAASSLSSRDDSQHLAGRGTDRSASKDRKVGIETMSGYSWHEGVEDIHLVSSTNAGQEL